VTRAVDLKNAFEQRVLAGLGAEAPDQLVPAVEGQPPLV
jgi:hypothetical protein